MPSPKDFTADSLSLRLAGICYAGQSSYLTVCRRSIGSKAAVVKRWRDTKRAEFRRGRYEYSATSCPKVSSGQGGRFRRGEYAFVRDSCGVFRYAPARASERVSADGPVQGDL